MHVYPLTDKIDMKFWRLQPLHLCCWVQQSIGTCGNTLRPNRKWKNQRWRPLNLRECMISAPRQDINEVPIAGRFRGPAFHWDLTEYCATKPEVDNPRWHPLNFKCMYLRFQTCCVLRFHFGRTYSIFPQVEAALKPLTSLTSYELTDSLKPQLNLLIRTYVG